MKKRWKNEWQSDDGEDRRIRSVMKKEMELPAELEEKKEMAFRKIRSSTQLDYNRRHGIRWVRRFAGIAACCCAALLVISGTSYAAGADNLFSRSFARIVEATSGNKDYNPRKIEAIAENAEEVKTVDDSAGSSSMSVQNGSASIAFGSAQNDRNMSETDAEGISIQAADYYCDGKILVVTLALKDPKKVLESYNFIVPVMEEGSLTSLCINGKDLGLLGDLYFQKDASGNFVTMKEINLRYYEVWNGCSFSDGEKLNVQIDLPALEAGYVYSNGIYSDGMSAQRKRIEGNWRVSFSGVCSTSGNHVLAENVTKGDVTLNSVVRTPANLWVDITVPEICNDISIRGAYAINLVLDDGTIVQPEDGMDMNGPNTEESGKYIGESAWRFVNPSGEHFTILVRAKDDKLTTLAEYKF